MKIKSITKKTEKLKVYDVTVEKNNHYILDNGIVSHNSYVPMSIMSGGSGLLYAASTIAFLTKKKDKEGNDVVGNIIGVKSEKSRFSKNGQKVELKLDFQKGLDRYFGLLPIAEKYGIIKKGARQYIFLDGSKVFGSKINADPEKYFTPDVLAQIDLACKKEFSLGELSEEELTKIAAFGQKVEVVEDEGIDEGQQEE